MKKFAIITGLLLFTAAYIAAQVTETDTTRIKLGKKKIIIIDANDEITDIDLDTVDFEVNIDEEDTVYHFNGHWGGVSFGPNNFVTSSFSTDLPQSADFLELNSGKSWTLNLNLFEKSFNLYNEQVGLVTGLGMEINNYRFSRNITLINDLDTISYYPDSIKFTKNKLTCTYITLPLMIEAQVPVGDENIYLAIGGIGAVKIGAHTKQVYMQNSSKVKDKVHEDFHLNPFRYGLTAKVGYGDISVFATYYLSTLFEADDGPELYPFNIGLSISL